MMPTATAITILYVKSGMQRRSLQMPGIILKYRQIQGHKHPAQQIHPDLEAIGQRETFLLEIRRLAIQQEPTAAFLKTGTTVRGRNGLYIYSKNINRILNYSI